LDKNFTLDLPALTSEYILNAEGIILMLHFPPSYPSPACLYEKDKQTLPEVIKARTVYIYPN
jgi:hypothetical protein